MKSFVEFPFQCDPKDEIKEGARNWQSLYIGMSRSGVNIQRTYGINDTASTKAHTVEFDARREIFIFLFFRPFRINESMCTIV